MLQGMILRAQHQTHLQTQALFPCPATGLRAITLLLKFARNSLARVNLFRPFACAPALLLLQGSVLRRLVLLLSCQRTKLFLLLLALPRCNLYRLLASTGTPVPLNKHGHALPYRKRWHCSA